MSDRKPPAPPAGPRSMMPRESAEAVVAASASSMPSMASISSKRGSLGERRGVNEFLAFRLAGETYALPLADVREILTPMVLTPVPRAPREILGIVSVRGLLVTVLDPKVRLRLSAHGATRRARILLVPSPSGELMGLFVDEVLQVYRLSEAEVELTTHALGGNSVEYVVGIGRRDGALLFLLALAPLLEAH
ncbi:MAG: chemotaxis protein CheW [Polyangiaceae bacterium]